jgi:hypothetical protein
MQDSRGIWPLDDQYVMHQIAVSPELLRSTLWTPNAEISNLLQ